MRVAGEAACGRGGTGGGLRREDYPTPEPGRCRRASVLSQRFANIFQGPRGAPETLRPRRGRVRPGGHRSVVADPEQGRAVLDEAPGVGGASLGPGICLRTSDSPH